jgi:hypothetical protein
LKKLGFLCTHETSGWYSFYLLLVESLNNIHLFIWRLFHTSVVGRSSTTITVS